MFSLIVTDTKEQTLAIFAAQADDDRPEIDYSEWHALQTWLEGADHRVYIPYAQKLAPLTLPEGVRMRRDFDALLSFIKANAILHQVNRERDQKGRIVATLDDYATVRELVAPIVTEGVGAAVSATMRETVNAVKKLADSEGPVRFKDVADALNLDPSSSNRRVHAAIDAGYVVNEQTKEKQPAILKLGDAMPEALVLLPSVQRLHDCMQSEGDRPLPPPEDQAMQILVVSSAESVGMEVFKV